MILCKSKVVGTLIFMPFYLNSDLMEKTETHEKIKQKEVFRGKISYS